jgi:hypothetical protein
MYEPDQEHLFKIIGLREGPGPANLNLRDSESENKKNFFAGKSTIGN